MDNCREYLENLCSYVDGEADDSICKEIEKHLSDCPDCRIMEAEAQAKGSKTPGMAIRFEDAVSMARLARDLGGERR